MRVWIIQRRPVRRRGDRPRGTADGFRPLVFADTAERHHAALLAIRALVKERIRAHAVVPGEFGVTPGRTSSPAT